MFSRVRQELRMSDSDLWCKTIGSGRNDGQWERVPLAEVLLPVTTTPLVVVGDWGLSVAAFPVFSKMQPIWIFMWNLPVLKCWHKNVQKHRESQTWLICVPSAPHGPRGCSLWTGRCLKPFPPLKGFALVAGCPFNLCAFGCLYYFCYSLSRVDEGLSVTVFINTLKNSIWYAECEVGLIWKD